MNWVNQKPVATAQTGLTVGENGQVPTCLNVTLSGTDVDNTVATVHTETLTYAIASQPAHGTATYNSSTGVATYTPIQYYVGSDSFTFTATDNGLSLGQTNLTSDPATISITVNHVNQKPIAASQEVTTAENTAITVTMGVSSNPDGHSLTYAATGASDGTLGTVSGPNVTYTPNNNWTGDDSFTFTATDNTDSPAQVSVAATVTVHVLSGAVAVDGTRPAYINFVAPSGQISWPFVNNSAGQTYTNSSKSMTVDANTAWNVSVNTMTGGASNGHMTKFDGNTYYSSVALADPLNVSATGAGATVNGKAAAAG